VTQTIRQELAETFAAAIEKGLPPLKGRLDDRLPSHQSRHRQRLQRDELAPLDAGSRSMRGRRLSVRDAETGFGHGIQHQAAPPACPSCFQWEGYSGFTSRRETGKPCPATLLHECGHSSMSPKRLDRNAAKFGIDG